MKFRVFIDKCTYRINGIDTESTSRKVFADKLAWDKTRNIDSKAIEIVYNTTNEI